MSGFIFSLWMLSQSLVLYGFSFLERQAADPLEGSLSSGAAQAQWEEGSLRWAGGSRTASSEVGEPSPGRVQPMAPMWGGPIKPAAESEAAEASGEASRGGDAGQGEGCTVIPQKKYVWTVEKRQNARTKDGPKLFKSTQTRTYQSHEIGDLDGDGRAEWLVPLPASEENACWYDTRWQIWRVDGSAQPPDAKALLKQPKPAVEHAKNKVLKNKVPVAAPICGQMLGEVGPGEPKLKDGVLWLEREGAPIDQAKAKGVMAVITKIEVAFDGQRYQQKQVQKMSATCVHCPWYHCSDRQEVEILK